MKMVSKSGYDRDAYTHQGWFSSDHRHIVFGDEVDELVSGFKTQTMVVFQIRSGSNQQYPRRIVHCQT